MKKLVIFDLDGTLAESKSAIDAEMSQLLDHLLGLVKLAVISGGDWQQFEDLCPSIFREVWGDRTAQKNGRSSRTVTPTGSAVVPIPTPVAPAAVVSASSTARYVL